MAGQSRHSRFGAHLSTIKLHITEFHTVRKSLTSQLTLQPLPLPPHCLKAEAGYVTGFRVGAVGLAHCTAAQKPVAYVVYHA